MEGLNCAAKTSSFSSDSARHPSSGGVVALFVSRLPIRSHKPRTGAHMALPTTTALEDDANWAVERATALPEVWALVVANSDGLVDAWRPMSVCRGRRSF